MRRLHVKILTIFLILIPALSGCSFVSKEAPAPIPTFAPPTLVPTPAPAKGAVILLKEGESLNIHLSAGEESKVIGTLPARAAGIPLLGGEELIGEELWVEIQASTGEAGWVNARYLTEYLPAEIFCADPQIQYLLDDFYVALENKDGDLLASLISPTHGLDLRYYRYGTVANYTPEKAGWVFKSDYQVNWGNEPGSGFEKIGSFSEIPLPTLLEVFGADYQLSCNDVGIAASFAPEPWLFEYTNINFYQLFKPGTEEYAQMDWQSWLVGVEYVDGKPYIFALIHFEWTP